MSPLAGISECLILSDFKTLSICIAGVILDNPK